MQRNNVEDVIHKYREDYFYTANEGVYNRYCVRQLLSVIAKLANRSELNDSNY